VANQLEGLFLPMGSRPRGETGWSWAMGNIPNIGGMKRKIVNHYVILRERSDRRI